MSDTYTYDQVMKRLGLVSHNAFYQLQRKYPHAFVVVQHGTTKTGKGATQYDKQALDNFIEQREALKQKGQP